MGVILAAAGTLVMAACVVATVARRRAPGMSLLRMPVFTWTAFASVLMVVGAFPVLIVAMTLLYIDRHGGHIFTGFNGTIDYQDLFWFFGHPVVYVMFFPYLGAAAEAIAVSSHKRWFGYVAVRRFDHGVRGAVDVGLGAPHVHDRRRHQSVLRVHLDATRRPGRNRVLRRRSPR